MNAWTPTDILTALYIIVGVMLVIVLYHALFVITDVRKITKRVQAITEELETVLMKPLSLTEHVFDRVLHYVEHMKKKDGKKKK